METGEKHYESSFIVADLVARGRLARGREPRVSDWMRSLAFGLR